MGGSASASCVWYTTGMIVAIDTGGTKTLVAGFDRDGTRGKTVRFETPADADEYVSLLRDTLEENFGNESVEVICLALPGLIKDKTVLWFGNLAWKNFDAGKALEGVLGGAPLVVENDANLAGLAESRVLEPTPQSSLYVTVSTGIGAGLTTDGRIDRSLGRIEVGHSILEFEGQLQKWENFASGRAIYNIYGQYARDITSEEIWQEIADRISRGFIVLIPIIQPDTIIIGGSIGTYFSRYGSRLEQLVRERLPDYFPCPPIIQAKNPEEAVIYGCYYHALDYLAAR